MAHSYSGSDYTPAIGDLPDLDEMTPIRQLDAEQYEAVEPLVESAEQEMRDLIESGQFQTTQPEDFEFTSNERAQTHALVPKTDLTELEDLEELIVGDLGEIPRSYGREFVIS